MNSNLCELHLAENRFAPRDALQLAILLTSSKSLQLIDLRSVVQLSNKTNDSPSSFLFGPRSALVRNVRCVGFERRFSVAPSLVSFVGFHDTARRPGEWPSRGRWSTVDVVVVVVVVAFSEY